MGSPSVIVNGLSHLGCEINQIWKEMTGIIKIIAKELSEKSRGKIVNKNT